MKSISLRAAVWAKTHWGVLVVALVSVWLVRHRPITFDGAMNLQVEQSLAAGRGYARHYHVTENFPMVVETNGPIILIGALLIWVFGQHNLVFQAPSVMFMVALAVVASFVLKGRWSNLLLLACFLGLPQLAQFGYNGYGEIPMLAFELAAILFVALAFERDDDRLMYVAAVFGGLAFVTKVVGIAVVIPIVAALLVRYWRRWPGWRVALQFVGAFLLGPFLWEVYRLVVLGSFGTWTSWWADHLDSVRYQAAGARTAQLPLDDSLWTRLGTLGGVFRVSQVTMAMLLLLALAALVGTTWFFYRLRDRHPGRFYLQLGLASMVVAYFAWWFFITPDEKAWYRRVLVAVFLMLLGLAHVLAVAVADRSEGRRSVARQLFLPVGVVLLLLVAGPLTTTYRDVVHPDTTELDTVVAASSWVSAKPADDRFFGYGFWSAPVISAYSQRDFLDLKRTDGCTVRPGHDYLVIDRSANALGYPKGFPFAAVHIAPLSKVEYADGTTIWEIGPAASCG